MAAVKLETPRFFNRGVHPVLKVVMCVLASVVLMTLDARWNYLEGVRQTLMTGLRPLQQAVLVPLVWLGSIAPYLRSKADLSLENERLQKTQLDMVRQTQELLDLRQENQGLRQLLQLQQRYVGQGVVAEVVYSDRDPFREKVWLNRGESGQIRAGYVAMDASGLIGQVTRSYRDLAEVTLFTDKDHLTPIKNQRSGVRAILLGLGAGKAPELRYVAASADFREGDLLITSGIDGVYPVDLPVATIVQVDRHTDAMFARIICRPVSAVDKNQHFLVLAPPSQLPTLPVDKVSSKTDFGRGRKLR